MSFDIVNAILTGFFLAFMVGPVFFILLETSATKGIKAAIIFDLGVILADAIFIAIAYYGSYTLLNIIKDDPRLFLIGGIVLFIFGLLSFIKEKKRKAIHNTNLIVQDKTNLLGLFIKGFLLNLINVGVLGFWLAIVVVVSANTHMNSHRVFWYFTIILSAYFITDLAKILAAKQLKNKMTPTMVTKTRKIMAIILMTIGLIIASKGFIPKTTIDKIQIRVEKAM